MISKACLATLLAIGVQGAWAQCADITAQVTYGAATSIMVSAATRATITDPVRQSQDITILSCAEATVGPSGAVNANGGTVTLSGSLPFAGAPDSNRATAYIIGPATIPTATYASISIFPSQSLDLTGASNVIINMAPLVTLAAQGILIQVKADGDDMNLTYDSDGGTVNFAGQNAVANINLIGVGDDEADVRIHGGASAYLGGRDYAAFAYDGANVEVTGSGLSCIAVEDASCFGHQGYATLTAGGSGYAEATGGVGNRVTVSIMGSGLVGGPQNTGVVFSGGALQVSQGAEATIEEGGVATIFSSVSDVTVSSSGTATMYIGATVTAAPGAFLRSISPQTEIRSIGDSGTNTVFEARLAPSGLFVDPEVRRARRAQPTGACGTGLSSCPNLRGVFGCVDTHIDIFNCGGCALTSGAGRDCSQVYDGAVACIRSVCLEL